MPVPFGPERSFQVMQNLHIKDALDGVKSGGVLRSRDTCAIGESLSRLIGESASDAVLAWAGTVGLRHMDAAELVQTTGISEEAAAKIVATRDLHAALETYDEPELTCSQEVLRALPRDLRNLETEVILGCALNARARLIAMVLLGRGGAGQTALTPKDVFQPMVRLGARAMILVHNHPSRSIDASDDDVRFTHRIIKLGASLGIPLLDHIIVAGRETLSLCQHGLMPVPDSLDELFDHSDG